MAEGGGIWVQDSSGRSKHASVCESASGRLRFRVDLRPGETTIVSLKKLLKEANLSDTGGLDSLGLDPSATERTTIPQPPPISPSAAPPSRKIMDNEPMDVQAQAGSNRLSNVIERIERMYAGNGSSDDEAGVLDNVPDDDEYDTNDSFIDDAELDDYFQVDKSAIKHDGFFVNRGKLERIEPVVSEDHQLKKRRRKYLTKSHSGNDEGKNPKKIAKLGNKGKRTSSSLATSHGDTTPDITKEAAQFQDTVTDSSKILSKKRILDPSISGDPSGVWGVGGNCQEKGTHQQGPEIHYSLNNTSKWKENNERSAALSQRSIDKYVDRREGSSARPKSTMLDKAIKELEKIVAESRPPSTEVLDPDNLSLAVKKRLPPEIKQKLGKVGRLAQQSSSGTIPKDVINRLMSIVGHLMQVRTLKRNLKVMANVGLPANQEKDDRILKIKDQLAEMLKLHVASLISKVQQHIANSGGIQENSPEEKDAVKRKYCMDDALENKICELYDLYAEGMEQDSRPPTRRVYEEIMVLWPGDPMDADVIKRAIYRAKERRGLSSLGKHGEKMMKKKALVPVPRGEDLPVLALMHTHKKKLSLESEQDGGFNLSSNGKGVGMSSPYRKMSLDKAKVNLDPVDGIPKKKVKKKPKNDVFEVQSRVEQKQVVAPTSPVIMISKPNFGGGTSSP